jgi:AraC-like DNA-binding protein/ligand-binding sensor protein
MTKTNIIQRRDLNPLLLKACKVVRYYEKAADCIVSVLGPDCNSIEDSRHPKAMLFCTLCKRYCQKELPPGEYPCTKLHHNAVQQSCRLGGAYIYTCPVGFTFWTSPIYSGERFAGALMSSGILAVERQQVVERIFSICKEEITHKEIIQYLEGIPEKTCEEVKALAQMMLICAEQLSDGEPYSWTVIDSGGGEKHPGPLPEIDCPMDKERMLIASLRRGDSDGSRKILKELLNILHVSSGDNFEYFKMRAAELVVLLSRAAVNSENVQNANTLELNTQYLRKIEDSKTAEEISENLGLIIDRIAVQIFSFQGIRHASALRKAERFIWENYTRKISLREVARVSGLSAPYFSTVFKDEMGENLSNYLNRLRVEKAAAMLKETSLPISEIAAACGFEDQSWFSKIFKSYTGFSPGKYREQGDLIPPEFSERLPGQTDGAAGTQFILRPSQRQPVLQAEFN